MPLDGWDHLELWVGNAKQAAYWYEHALGFERTAYAGPETGVRDRASYVLEQGEIRLVLTSGVRADSGIVDFAARHGDAAKNIALRVKDAGHAFAVAVERGATADRRAAVARGRPRPRRARHDRNLRRGRPHLRQPCRVRRSVPARLRLAVVERPPRQGRRADRDRPRRRQRRARQDEPLGRVLRAGLRDDEHRPLRRRPDPDRVLGADEQGDGGRRAARSSSRSTSRPRASGRARSTSTSSSTKARACSTSRCSRGASSRRSRR